MKKIIFLTLIGTTIFLSGCVSQSKYDELSQKLEETKTQLDTVYNTIDDCNSQIREAQDYAGGTYEEMNHALENLGECYF